ncbi:phosphate ABC transporter substrate-binding protein (PhoT family) [Paraburkholderia sp. BL6669N2]|uniref:phosphate ABC transporter substrate-binding protein PstS n=1 Tax=Paraburkholderia sp. BL6669N2 TaxID=1938807 RepID=UPI000E250203|nr:phosphate ABC transporter substrate-binding protein PstS [Paraburkholderia sp. BL6669N2]REG50915.1 phosphate ABC transporter substrate-binding protein (PhoT family) [Paraburkholderia sp. BL6669N2]
MRHYLTFVTALAAGSFVVPTYATDITGAGSTFAAPLYNTWAAGYQKSGGGKVSYYGVGSSDGLKQIVAKEVDFAGSDAPLSDGELMKDGLLQFPTAIGGVVPVVNLPGIKAGELMLSGPLLGEIFLGKIKYWDDPAIAQLNPKIKLPDTPIAVVRRQDGSGTTLIWTHYLAQVSPEWKRKVGEGTSVHWPLGIGGKGNEGVATYVGYLPGAIGYVAWDFTKQNHMTYAAMRNASGAAVEPSSRTFKAAAASTDWSRSLYQLLTNQLGKDAWPVIGATYVLLHPTQDKPGHSDETLKFFDWAFINGGRAAEDLDYIPLPDSVVTEIRSQWRTKASTDILRKAVAGQ